MSNKISHSGVVESVLGGCVKVRILQTSACVACKVAGHCNASESKEKIVDVYCADSDVYQPGQQVVVSASCEVASRALLLGFGMPFVLLVAVLVVILWMTANEGVAALSALLSLAPYYIILWLMRDRIQRRISFHLE